MEVVPEGERASKRPHLDPSAEKEEKVPDVDEGYASCNDADEDILDPKNDTGTTLDGRHPHLMELYNEHKANFWDVGEVEDRLHADKFSSLPEAAQSFLSFLLIFFLTVDSIVMQNVSCNFLSEVTLPEAKQFFAFQGAMEGIHAETYKLFVQHYIREPAKIRALREHIKGLSSMKRKNAYCLKYMNPDLPFAVRLVAFSCVEGIFFCGAFAGIFWQRRNPELPGLTFGNGLIFFDESLHVKFATALFHEMKNRPTEAQLTRLVTDAVDIECAFMRDALPMAMDGMNYPLMERFIKYVGDRRLVALGCSPVYNIENPFGFMTLTSTKSKTNFFEKGNAGYVRGSSVDTTIDHEAAFNDL